MLRSLTCAVTELHISEWHMSVGQLGISPAAYRIGEVVQIQHAPKSEVHSASTVSQPLLVSSTYKGRHRSPKEGPHGARLVA